MGRKSDTPRARHISEAKPGDIVFIVSRPMRVGYYTRARVTRVGRSSIWAVSLIHDTDESRVRMERRFKSNDGREHGAHAHIRWFVEPGVLLTASEDEKRQLKREIVNPAVKIAEKRQ